MCNQLQTLLSDLANYRDTVDQIFSSAVNNPEAARLYFLDLLISTTRLYFDYQLLRKESPSFQTASQNENYIPPKANLGREKALRDRLREHLEMWPIWSFFSPENPFSELTGLHNLSDYTDSFSLHLSEIYEETFQVEGCTKSFLANPNNDSLADMLVGMEHLGRNHISFVLQALEWTANEISWEDAP